MKMFEGTLQVETIRGRRGPFNVGKLITDIGEFKVKDKEFPTSTLNPQNPPFPIHEVNKINNL